MIASSEKKKQKEVKGQVVQRPGKLLFRWGDSKCKGPEVGMGLTH